MEVRDRQQVLLTRREPALPSAHHALRAVPVAARVVGDLLVPAAVATLDDPTQGGGAAALDRVEHLRLGRRDMTAPGGDQVRADDVGHLQAVAHGVRPATGAAAWDVGGWGGPVVAKYSAGAQAPMDGGDHCLWSRPG